VRQAIEAEVKCIDHGQLLDDATAKLMADQGIWWRMQPFTDDRPSPSPEGSATRWPTSSWSMIQPKTSW
jgi:imidazolonepropionase-like amidohydrolase